MRKFQPRHKNIARLLAVLSALWVLALPLAPQAEELVTDLSEHLVAIESNFTGTEILLFGAVETDAQTRALRRDVVVVLRGPAQNLTVRRKARRAGIWVNAAAKRFTRVPGFYAVISTRPLPLIAERTVLRRHEIGLDNLNLRIAGTPPKDLHNRDPFGNSLVRLKSRQGLYREVPGGVTFRGDTLFRAVVDIPANVQVGYYTADVFLFRDGKVVHAQSSPLYINKSGFERFVFNLAQRQPLIYGLLAVLLALAGGWLAATLLRRR